MRVVFSLLAAGAVGVVLSSGCGGGAGVGYLPEGGADGGAEAGTDLRGVGQRCDDGGVCRPGLACAGGVCEPGRSLDTGSPCVISAECKDGLYCGPERTCAPAGSGAEGATCTSDGDCKSGLRCNVVGFEAQCQPEGKGDVGGTCTTNQDCFGGLLCASNVCAPPPPGGPPPLAIPSFQGVECEAETGPVTAHFSVPRGTGDKDFFRLPFPNDIRVKGGKLDLTGFPTPGASLLGYDIIDRWARFLEQTGSGWSVYPTVSFRFSGEIDFASLKDNAATKWVDITPGEGNELGHNWSSTTGRTAYVCPNGLHFRPPTGAPLKPGHTYAVLVTNGAKAKDGSNIAVSPDFTAVLGASDPGGALSAAWTAYAPLRTWAASKSFSLASLINAAVFTVGRPDELVSKLATAVQAQPVPTATGWVKCGGGAVSPCTQGACPANADPAFDELHALVTLPNFQAGTAPYLKPAEGGGLVLDGTGQPVAQGTISVCMSLTVPKSAMPANGWPLVVYAHGTGGSFRSHVTEGVAARLASVDGATRMAVLGIDQASHGSRRGASTVAPQSLFFNFENPAAARGNVLQGAADQMALVRFAKALSLPAGTSPTGAEIKVDRVAFWGHSQGATEGAVAMPYTPDVAGVVFSGVGGSLIDSLLTKTKPVNISQVVPIVLAENPAYVGAAHPALGMLQNAIDPADPLDHAGALIGAGGLAKHVFVPYGQGDTYSTPITQLTYVAAARLAVAQHPASVTNPDNLLKTPTAIPISGNATGGLTAVVRQYAPASYDGHFVVFQNADARVNADRFLADAVTGVTPSFGR